MSEINELLRNYVRTFLGYGTLNSKIWLVGPEQGGGTKPGEFLNRVKAWEKRGQKEIEDLHSYHSAIGIDWTKSIQQTWGRLIRIMLACEGKLLPQTLPSLESQENEKAQVLAFQRNHLGINPGGDNCILDLMPIASPSRKDWGAKDSDQEWLRTREKCEKLFLPERSDLIRYKISQHKPKLVVFFGSERIREWQNILHFLCAKEFVPSNQQHMSWAMSPDTFFAFIPHPGGIRPKGNRAVNRCLAEIGHEIRKTIDKHGFKL